MATKVLIVEDDPDTRSNLCDILHMDGYHADTATTAADAIDRVDETEYALIIIDWHLPDMTAGELLPQLRSRAPDATILIATGSSDLQHAIEAMQHGASDYIVKPICPELLLGSMQRAMKLQSAQQRAIQSERLAAVGTAVAAVAHESRSLLQRIRARVDLIRLMHENDADLLSDLSAIEDASSQLQSHFEELREFSAPIVLNKSPRRLHDLVHRVWDHLQCAGGRPDAQLCVTDNDVQCKVDPVRIGQVLRNLFENAIAACEGEPRVEVDWSICQVNDEETVRITVRDNGPGFSEEERVAAFEPFFTTKGHGTGLGLPICRRIVEAHGGSIDVEDGEGIGGVITIALPGPIRSSACHTVACAVRTDD